MTAFESDLHLCVRVEVSEQCVVLYRRLGVPHLCVGVGVVTGGHVLASRPIR